ncbi:AGCS family alanine or glycine:cation symporter [Parabacteroides sp. PF5-5]|uniref:alanine/glycine:cation symporter family protein n=1 Tax=unclassified Parabacteroides TaxID=2649774 RepID=UPI0024763E8F|nr:MULTISPECIES: sodium:alanine symporter family protein [unclassified Parabacteroides]MDH6305127.1 AGCS family alanine or glycine:cation symporter [Parabacteroides sp. PH5-39]MDH6316477.1 AGCS family alanine or glycine:cation symporter [Parabacteroides sp. PF5-13]MDH6319987.1 AGCS family alanine or glycine:cation symporter [Parabacteroides sp. PH5-13]MDH6323780.1 AGCS family alanine or glycine:cation symporter [Parabacteroides sp. PH5-8]MDH6327664.1 AGCS family alanine or glycine:cation sympo
MKNYNIMQQLNDILSLIDSYFGGSQWFVFLLLGTGFFFTFYLKFPQIRFFRHAIRVLSGKYDKEHHIGDTSHFQALSTALSGTVGTGNIAGVALAIHLGGPSALFWMLMTAFAGMTTKLVEVTLSHKYREQTEDGTISGGPMYYMKNRLNMRWLAAIFAVATIFSSFGTGSLPQINSISNAMFATFGIKHYATGAVLAFLLALIVIGGIKRIAKVSERLVPFMAVVYVLGAISVLAYNYQHIIPSFISIFSNVFSGTAAMGGFLGATVVLAFNRGVNRGLFSNEAGQGSAPIAHAAARTEEPVSEGMVALLEPFIDTIIICLLTGLVILSSGAWVEKTENQFQQADLIVLSGVYQESDPVQQAAVSDFIQGKKNIPLYSGSLSVRDGLLDGNTVTLIHARSFAEEVKVRNNDEFYTGEILVRNGRIDLSSGVGSQFFITGKSLTHSAPLSTEAFKKGFLGDWGKYIIPLSLLLFAFTTTVAWSYYGDRAVTYLWGSKYVRLFHIIYVATYFLASFTDTTIVWAFSGVTIALMTLPNLIGILLLHKEVKASINEYWAKVKRK